MKTNLVSKQKLGKYLCFLIFHATLFAQQMTWIQATDSAGWTRREFHTSVIFNNKMWVLGGEDYNALKNDVWYSTDGASWFCATNSAEWSPRDGHTTVVFNNKIWVLGGIDEYTLRNDVWYSSDGINWFCATNSAEWSPRGMHTSVVFDNKMWVLGGTDYNGNRMNDIWYSSDGVNWACATNSAEWSPRSQFTSLIFNNKMWVLGGGWPPLNDVWYSNDGINWICATDSTGWSGRFSHTAVVFDNKMWIIAGCDYNGPQNDVWYSIDSANWVCATNSPGWRWRYMHTSVVLDDKILLLGGYAGSSILEHDVWYSNGLSITEEGDLLKSDGLSLKRIYPNPFSRYTLITYSLSKTSAVKLSIFDSNGNEVKVLTNEIQGGGLYAVKWNGRGASEQTFPVGIYFVHLSVNSFSTIKKIILMR